MRLVPVLPVIAALLLGACDGRREPADPGPAPAAQAPAAPASPAPPADSPDASAAVPPVDTPGVGLQGYAGAHWGDGPEAVRKAWAGVLGDAPPGEPGACHYLIPQPLGPEGYRIAFMIEGDRLVRIDVRDPAIVAPGGARQGMAGDEVRALYQGRLEEQPHKYDPAGRVLRVTAPDGGPAALVFELDADGRVDAWRVGVPPQVDYVEGCS
jgi:hypothetical protein